MLLRFSVSNFRSIREKQELSLIAATSLKDEAGQLLDTPIADTKALRVAAIYGANASGKSNILRALDFMTFAVAHSQSGWKPDEAIPRTPFALDGSSKSRPSDFDVEVVIDSVRYAYGFSLSDKRVEREYLYAFPRGRQQVWFERDASAKKGFEHGKHLLGENKTIWALTRPNSLFLSAAVQNNHKMLSPIDRWFRSQLYIFEQERRNSQIQLTLEAASTEEGRAFVLHLLESADLGIVDLVIRREKPTKESLKVFEAIRSAVPGLPLSPPPGHSAQLLHKTCDGTGKVPLSFHAESSGTKALFALACDIRGALAKGGVLVVDELENSLHPAIALEVARTFTDPRRNPRGAQLLFTTHNTHLLSERALRRDQVWLTEKNEEGATRLYPLTDFKPRRDENLELGYLQGRYGAIPFFGANAFQWNQATESINGKE